ncbi:DUF445 domain-containing protein [Bacillus suaedaesalsae]|uniref:DUF445 domain-containing protein n=1 Tax=Bacillus suaedaesalsae TaxID=2810349 RepID=A0ABS2DH23_9BACI|nr:DUF445 family protein [Bacillus suaedaesalsae]MBM6617780.1 DUF445 domain-containing protein [Bacillus suaedaesalsae]
MVLLTIGMMVVIGAIIGGVTNHLAIKMLFRPHQAKYIMGKRVPFTPGLIPKRRDELAVQMGKLVVEHLVTAEGIKQKFQESSFINELTILATNEATKFLQSDKTVLELADDLGIKQIDDKLNEKLKDALEIRITRFLHNSYNKPLHELFPSQLLESAEEKIPSISEYITLKGAEYFESEEGKAALKKMIDDFLSTRGMLGNMIQMFLGQGSLIEKVHPEIVKFMQHQGTKDIITRMIRREWNKLKNRKLEEFSSFLSKEQAASLIKRKIIQELSVSTLTRKPLKEIVAPVQAYIVERGIPFLVEKAGSYLASHTDVLLKKLRVEDLVRDQVEGFSVDRLEDMVLSISKREFKMITYLGAVLGGIIGLFQGILAIAIG